MRREEEEDIRNHRVKQRKRTFFFLMYISFKTFRESYPPVLNFLYRMCITEVDEDNNNDSNDDSDKELHRNNVSLSLYLLNCSR